MSSLLIRSRFLARNANLKCSYASLTTNPAKLASKKDNQNELQEFKSDLSLLKPEEADHRKKLQGYITIKEPDDISPITGVPEEHIKGRKVRIYELVKNCTQNGTDEIWEMEFDNRQRWQNPLMGWASSGDPLSNLKVQFLTKEDAIAHCEKNGWQWFVQERTVRPMRPHSYGDNFSWNKRTRTSTK